MKILFAVDAVKYPLTGIGRYTLELVNQLNQDLNISKLLYFNKLSVNAILPKYDNYHSYLQSIISVFLKKNFLLIDIYRLIYPKIQKIILRRYYADFIYHSPNYYIPAGFSRAVTTFHDISIFTFPEFHPSERVYHLKKEMEISLMRANRIITVSEFSKQELVRYFNYPAGKIDVIYLAYGKEFYPRNKIELLPLVQRLKLKIQGYSLFVGTIEPRKNITILLDAYQKLSPKLRQYYPLVICGYYGWSNKKEYYRLKQAIYQGWLIYLSYVPSTELPILFSAAKLFIFPSLYEGFGLPVLEAMASGVPVVCSNTTSLPEITCNIALTCDPFNLDDLSEKIAIGLQDDAWRIQIIKKGIIHAKIFSWQKCAQDTIKVYYKL